MKTVLEGKCKVSVQTLKRIVDSWWFTWHRFALEDEEPPSYIQEIINELRKNKLSFKISTGHWII